jgi:hypothetical protein
MNKHSSVDTSVASTFSPLFGWISCHAACHTTMLVFDSESPGDSGLPCRRFLRCSRRCLGHSSSHGCTPADNSLDEDARSAAREKVDSQQSALKRRKAGRGVPHPHGSQPRNGGAWALVAPHTTKRKNPLLRMVCMTMASLEPLALPPT